MDTTEQNILIAEFMNYPKDEFGKWLYFQEGKARLTNEELKFHTSFGHLIPVVAMVKAELTAVGIDIFESYIASAHELEDAIWANDITKAHEVVVSLIIILNQGK